MKHNFCVLQAYIACWSNGPTRDQKKQFSSSISFKYGIHEKGLLTPIPEQRTSCSVLQRTGRYSKLKVLDAFWLIDWYYPLDWKIICRFQPGLQTHHSLLEPYIINYYRWYRKTVHKKATVHISSFPLMKLGFFWMKLGLMQKISYVQLSLCGIWFKLPYLFPLKELSLVIHGPR